MGTCSCYQLSIRAWLGAWVKTNRSVKNDLPKSLPSLPFDLFFNLSPRDSFRAYVHTFAHAFVKRGKRCNFTCLFQWTGILVVVVWWKYLWSYVFMLEFLLPQVYYDAYYSSMLCNLFLYGDTLRIVLYLVPVSLRSINFRRRIMGKCPCIVWSDKALFCFTKHMLGC
jgi:hypothetical protein